jgi:hypothetical protein
MEIVNKRLWAFLDGLGLADKLNPNPNYGAYYTVASSSITVAIFCDERAGLRLGVPCARMTMQ